MSACCFSQQNLQTYPGQDALGLDSDFFSQRLGTICKFYWSRSKPVSRRICTAIFVDHLVHTHLLDALKKKKKAHSIQHLIMLIKPLDLSPPKTQSRHKQGSQRLRTLIELEKDVPVISLNRY